MRYSGFAFLRACTYFLANYFPHTLLLPLFYCHFCGFVVLDKKTLHETTDTWTNEHIRKENDCHEDVPGLDEERIFEVIARFTSFPSYLESGTDVKNCPSHVAVAQELLRTTFLHRLHKQ
mmetsp:Transcript_3491/g.5947  ORF Transcript_3491/g.5947 Transcript_3491/m.5947 type:complete len:120 (-) Transcript_3491:246-605(-)